VITNAALGAARIAAFMLVVSSASAAGAAIVGDPLAALRRADLGAIENVRCCGWGPRGWYDTWRNCHYCGFGHPYGYCRFSVPRWRWFCPR
jgi:hypothetical protein